MQLPVWDRAASFCLWLIVMLCAVVVGIIGEEILI